MEFRREINTPSGAYVLPEVRPIANGLAISVEGVQPASFMLATAW